MSAKGKRDRARAKRRAAGLVKAETQAASAALAAERRPQAGGVPLPSAWRTTPVARGCRADSRLRWATHRAGKARGYHVPDYSTGDALADAVQASVAADMLAMLDRL